MVLKPIIEEYEDWQVYSSKEKNHDRMVMVLGFLISRLYDYAVPKIKDLPDEI
jgi:hypothetical protein